MGRRSRAVENHCLPAWAKLRIPVGASLQFKGGDRSSPSQVKCRGIAEPSANALEFRRMQCLPRSLGFRAVRPSQQVALTPAAVGASKAFDRDRQVRKGGDQMTFVAAQKRPGSEHGSGLRQEIDVPVYWLAVSHVARETRPKAARPLGRATVQIPAGSQER
jgi:hypothetical protein